MQTEASRPSNPMAIGSLLNESIEAASVLGIDRRLDTQYAPHQDSHVEPAPRPKLQTRLTEPLPAVRMVPTANSPILQGWPLSPVLSATSDRSSSQNNISPTMKRRASIARAPRPKYEEQQGFFIWYHRTDLCEPWDQVIREFRSQFGQNRPKGGLQCKFYRMLEQWQVEKVRTQTRGTHEDPRDRIGAYGVLQRTNKRFEWMRSEHLNTLALPQFRTRDYSPCSAGPCTGCADCV